MGEATRQNRLWAFVDLVVTSYKAWQKARAGRLAAALAFYTLLSMAPSLYLVVSVFRLLYGTGAALNILQHYVSILFGVQAGEMFYNLLQNTFQARGTPLSTALNAGALLWGGSGFFIHLKEALNTMWEVPPPERQALWRLALDRLLSFAITLLLGVLLFVAIIANTTLNALGALIAFAFGFPVTALGLLRLAIFFAIFVLLLAVIYKILPDARVAWGDVWVGAGVTAILMLAGQAALAVYLSRSRLTTLYGAGGVVIAVLVWVYYLAQILFLGAQFTREYANRFGSRIRWSGATEKS